MCGVNCNRVVCEGMKIYSCYVRNIYNRIRIITTPVLFTPTKKWNIEWNQACLTDYGTT